MDTYLFAKSSSGLPIYANTFKGGGKHVAVLAGVHGDEIEGIALAKALTLSLDENKKNDLSITVVDCLNVDGFLARTRQNQNGVDLNRNLPTKDWNKKAFNERYNPGDFPNSEEENKHLVNFIERTKIDFIISLHSFKRTLLNVNGNCSPMSGILHDMTGLPIEDSMGYPTPGCLGTYAGLERGIPTITYELERGSDLSLLVPTHLEALLQSFFLFDKSR